MISKDDHSYIIYELHKCTDEIRESVGQLIECAEDQEIENWLKGKKLGFKIIQDKIDFSKFDNSLIIRKKEA